MHKILIITIAAFLINLTANGQNLFIIGERSYPSTNVITFESNADNGYDLDVFMAKEGEFGFFGVSRKFSVHGEKFTGKLLIYLDNGSVITCNESEVSEKVDDRAKALYPLTADQLSKLKINNIHTLKYTMVYYKEENFSASNPGVKTNAIISELFDPTDESNDMYKSSDSMKQINNLEELEAEPLAYDDQMPSFPNGTEAMYRYVYDKIEYPAVARANGISGQVIVQFVISADGEVQQAKIVRGIGGGCNEEALRVINGMPKWNPGKHNGRNVPVIFTLPIKFAY